MGNVGNRMIQYMVALALADHVPDAVLAQIHLPEWGIQIAPLPAPLPRTTVVVSPRVDLAALAAALKDGRLDCVDIRTYGQRLENFLPASAYRDVFRAPGPPAETAGPDELLCNIRQGDILDARHPDYVLVPIDFYAELVAQTGLRPVFMGQLDPSPYLDELTRRFPQARFLPSLGGVADFDRIRRARHIVPSVSTFGWLAAWLSDAETIHMPLLGLLNPLQSRSTFLAPLDDPRFSFTLFPAHYAVPVADFAAAHAAIRGLWRRMPAERLAPRFARPPPGCGLEPQLAVFDEAAYLAAYPDVASAVAAGHFPSGRHHFAYFGFAEGRDPCAVDKAWYCQSYPIAAVEVGQGDYLDPVRHYIEIGRFRGYKPTPEGET